MSIRWQAIVCGGVVLGAISVASAQEDGMGAPPPGSPVAVDSPADAASAEEIENFDSDEDAAAASNPLSSASNLDIKIDYYDLDGSNNRYDFNTKLSFMAHPRLKMNIEAHYWNTDVTGSTENDWEQVSLKPIFFVKDTALNDRWKLRIAAGGEWIIDFDNADKGIGSGSDQIAPLLGLAFNDGDTGLTLIPLVQHFESYDGPDVSTTAFRLIVLKPLPNSMWLKLDGKLPFDWENNTEPATFETELGKMLNGKFGVFVTAYVGAGGDRPYDWGIGPAVRFRF